MGRSVKEILIGARKRIKDPRNHIKGKHESNGAYCMTGALYAEGVEPFSSMEHPAYIALQRAAGLDNPKLHLADTQLSRFNDLHTHEEVLAVFDKAIEEAE